MQQPLSAILERRSLRCNRLQEPTLEVVITSHGVGLGVLPLSMYSSAMVPFNCKLDHTARTCIALNGDLDDTDRGRNDDGSFYTWRDRKFGTWSREKEQETCLT